MLPPPAGGLVGLASVAVRVFAASYLLNTYGVNVSQAYGSSMIPTLATKGDVVLLDMSAPYRWRAAYRYGDRANTVLAVGDVVTLSKPTDRRVSIIKRIGGMPGDTVTVERPAGPPEVLTVPPGHVWVVGDNAAASIDCRYYGPVPAALLTGKVLCRIWPPSAVGTLPPAPVDAVGGREGETPPPPPTAPLDR
ncbi:hypothetical protein MMPV_007062 [Pyropia vietnamensis]